MKLKINHNFKISDILPVRDKGKSLWMQLSDLGIDKSMAVPGMIGQGTKIHNFHIGYVDTDNGMGIHMIMSTCGSAKFNSHIRPIFDTDYVVDCKKCLK